ncbi:MAG: TlpA disulfide reductase family protein [Terracidiphilus sp.]
MNSIQRTFAAAAILLIAPLLSAQVSESAINKQLEKLRSLSDTQRPVATIKLAGDIRTLRAGPNKVGIANDLANLVTEGDQGAEALQAVADTLSQALAESPMPAKKDVPPAPYFELAKLVRYEGVKTTLNDPLLAKASETLVGYDADVQKADFTLRDIKNKKVTLSELRGKIVMVNFWATWCPPCRKEMPDLDIIYTHFQSQGLVILSVTDDDPLKVIPFITQMGYHPPVLFDSDGKARKLFHVNGIPKNFVFDREGKLVAQSIDECTQHRLLMMLAAAGLHP